jgi:maltose O-acetyltransferase
MWLRKMRDRWADLLSAARVAYYRLMGVTIGRRCYISSGAHIDVARGKVNLGNRVSIASGSYILSHAAGRPPLGPGQQTRLEDNVTVFVNSIVLPGVTVGKNSIVAAGAVVTRDVPPDVVVMGNPARVVWYKGNKKRDGENGA